MKDSFLIDVAYGVSVAHFYCVTVLDIKYIAIFSVV